MIGSTSLRASFWKTHREAENLQSFINFARFLAADRGLDDVLHVGNVDAVARDLVAIDFDLQISEPADLFDVDIRRAAALSPSTRATASPFCFSTSRSSPKILIPMADFTPLTSSSTRNAIGCEKLDATPGNSASASRIFSTSSSLDFVGRPFLARLERDDHIAEFDAHRIGSDVGAAGFRNHVDDFRKLFEDFLDARLADRAIAAARCSECEIVCTAIEPSSSDGRNSVPMQRHERECAYRDASEPTATTSHG